MTLSCCCVTQAEK